MDYLSHLILTTVEKDNAIIIIILISDLGTFSTLPRVTELVSQCTESYHPIDLYL